MAEPWEANPFSFCSMTLTAISWAWLSPCCSKFFAIVLGCLKVNCANLLKRAWLRWRSSGSLDNGFRCLRLNFIFRAANGWHVA